MSEIICCKCRESNYYRSGKVNGKQRYKCKSCGCHFTINDRREKYSVKQKIVAITLFKKGLSLRSIAEVIGANNVIVLYWIKNIGKFIKDTVLDSVVQSNKDLEVVEMDELWHYVQKKEKTMDMAYLLWCQKKNHCL